MRNAFQEVLRRLYTIQKNRRAKKLPSLQILALDMPQQKTEFSTWFLTRDTYMFQKLLERSKNIAGKGILFWGAAHLTCKGYPMPEVLSKQFKMNAPIDSLGKQINKFKADFPKRNLQSISFWLQPIVPKEEWVRIPLEYQPVYKIQNFIEKKYFLLSTKMSDFFHLEKQSGVEENPPLQISKNFDYYLSIK